MSTAAEVTEGGAKLTWVLAAGAGVATVGSANAGPASHRQRRTIAGVALIRKLADTVP